MQLGNEEAELEFKGISHVERKDISFSTRIVIRAMENGRMISFIPARTEDLEDLNRDDDSRDINPKDNRWVLILLVGLY